MKSVGQLAHSSTSDKKPHKRSKHTGNALTQRSPNSRYYPELGPGQKTDPRNTTLQSAAALLNAPRLSRYWCSDRDPTATGHDLEEHTDHRGHLHLSSAARAERSPPSGGPAPQAPGHGAIAGIICKAEPSEYKHTNSSQLPSTENSSGIRRSGKGNC